jgi:hypothetical protein
LYDSGVPRDEEVSVRSGTPGVIAAPAILLVLSVALLVIAVRDPELIDLGPHLSAAGLGVLGASGGFFWLLVALGKKRAERQ